MPLYTTLLTIMKFYPQEGVSGTSEVVEPVEVVWCESAQSEERCTQSSLWSKVIRRSQHGAYCRYLGPQASVVVAIVTDVQWKN